MFGFSFLIVEPFDKYINFVYNKNRNTNLLYGERGVVIMKKTRKFNVYNFSKYLPVAIILLSLSIIIGSTFAYFTDNKQAESTLVFSKVELSSESTTGINGTLQDVIPGALLIDSPVTFSKAIDSEPMYVRVKVSYSLPVELQSNQAMLDYVNILREAKSYDVVSTEQNGAVWSTKNGNYFYLLDSADNTRLKVVDDVYTYKFTDSIIIPRDLEQLDEQAQYMQVINFHLAFEAIQAENVSDSLSETKEIFNSLFPQSDSESYKEPINVNFLTESGGVFSSIEIDNEGKIVEIEYEPEDENAVFSGWFVDAELTQPFDFDTVVTENTTLYPKVLTVNYDNFEFNGSTLTKFVGTDSEVIIPSSYSISGTHEVTTIFKNYSELNQYKSSLASRESIIVVDNNDISQEITRSTSLTILRELAYPVSCTHEADKYVKGSTYQVTIIGNQAFYQNKNIVKVVLPETITQIGNSAFYSCTNLVDINFPESLTTIGTNSLRSGRIAEFYVGKNLTSIPDNPFWTDTMEKITIHPDNPKYYVENNCLIERDTKTLILGCNNSIIPDGVKIIGKYAFRFSKIKEAMIPNGVTMIEHCAFSVCSQLEKVEIPNSVITINNEAFAECSKLKSIEIPNSVTTIGDYALKGTGLEYVKLSNNISEYPSALFSNCDKLNNVVIGSKVTAIGTYAFMYCTGLTNIYIDSSTIASNPNSGSSSNYLLSYVENVYIKTSISSVSSTFKKVDNTIHTYEGVNYYLYTV